MNRADHNHGFARLDQLLVVFAQATGASQPSKRAFGNPALGQQHKTLRPYRARDNLELVIGMLRNPAVQLIIMVFAVRPNDAQAREAVRIDTGQGLLGALGIVHRGSRDRDGQQHSQRIHDDVALAAGDFLATIVAAFSALGGLDRLAVDRGGAGRDLPVVLQPYFDAQSRQDLSPDGVTDPGAEIVVDGFPGRKLMRQHAPLTTRAIQIEQRVENLTQIGFARSPTRLGRRQQGFDELPLLVRKIGGVWLPFHAPDLGKSAFWNSLLVFAWHSPPFCLWRLPRLGTYGGP